MPHTMNQDFWNTRYTEPGYAYGTEPNAFLVSQQSRLQPGMRALAVADGEGRNGVWLARQGLDVLSVDASDVGLRKTRALAAAKGVRVRTEQVDLTTWDWPQNEFDVVVAIYIHFPPESRARMHQKMFEALKPGGVLILEAFTPEQLNYQSGGPPVREMLFTAPMLRNEFSAGEILLLEETRTELEEGVYHRGPAAVVRAVVRKARAPQ
jgi:cyclopropane fatty-acyl-phospholipid synthase-like methyltransferase